VAVALVLLTFGSAVGLSLTSPFQGEGVSAAGFAIAVGLWFVWVQVSSFMAGGYLAGRMRRRLWIGTEHEVEVRDGAVRRTVDLRGGQKTGLFLDQRENYTAAARYAHGRALDAFSYQGGFALHLAGACESVLAVDSSAPALAGLEETARQNGVTNVEAREGNVFDVLRELEACRDRFGTVVLDPPAFAKNKAAVERAVTAYKEINLRAIKLLEPGGYLVTCSCSYNISESHFEAIVAGAAADARADLVLVEKRAQGRDHPILVGVPETHYLKALILRRLA